MTTVLHIDASARVAGSASRAASAKLVRETNAGRVIYRDLAAAPLPQITEDWVKARMTPIADQSPQETVILALSDHLVSELIAADILILGVPLYNFGIPASLKAWADLVARPKVTFRYIDGGVEGLLSGKKAIVTLASGGIPMGAPEDLATPHLRVFLDFIGISDVTFQAAADV